jgi:kynurenine formamidase
VGTQFDGLAHVGVRMRMADGVERDVFYNGFTLDEVGGTYGMRRLGVENVRPVVTRGILIDVAGAKGMDVLPDGYHITLQDVRETLARQGMSEGDIRPGDAIFFRTGRAQFWTDPARYARGAPGIGLEVGEWVADRRVSMIGADTAAIEADPTPGLVSPVHELLIVRNGIHNLENMNLEGPAADGVYEFLFIFTPLRLEGATGSPGRPIGIR